ncbi:MAG: hypothetical protein JWN44_2249 [Myxococcales bacterium]|nr:hypothetical protein [Myxococcales bacterium]
MRISVAAARVAAVAAVWVALAGAGCSAPHRTLTVAPTLERCANTPTVNTVRISALGDFPPQATLTAAASPSGPATLELPRATRQVAIEGFGPTGLAMFGRTPELSLDDAAGALGVAYGPPDGLCATAQMVHARAGHRATRLGSGAVLISGGVASSTASVAPLEIYRPDLPRASFAELGAIDAAANLGHAATALADGGALITGGAPSLTDDVAYQGATRYDQNGRQVGRARLLVNGRASHTATLLPDGRVLLAGGCRSFVGGSCSALATTELYDPDADTFVVGPPLLHPRFDHDAVLRGDGTVLLVGGGPGLPAEVVDPNEFRSFDAGLVNGRAAPFATGAILVAAGTRAPATGVALWLSPSETPLTLPSLADARRAPTLTPLDDGAVLVAGGGDTPLALVDPRGAVTTLAASFPAREHAAALLDDGTVLLTGGTDATGVASADASLYFRSPLSAWANLPPLTLDGAAAYLPRRPDRAAATAGQLVVTAATASADSRPVEFALVAGMEVADFTFDLLAGRRGDGGAVVILGWRSEASFAFVIVDPGRPVELWTVSSPRAGQTQAGAVANCRGAVLPDGALPDGDTTALAVDWRAGRLVVTVGGTVALSCRPTSGVVPRGKVGVGALHGTVAFDNLAVTR